MARVKNEIRYTLLRCVPSRLLWKVSPDTAYSHLCLRDGVRIAKALRSELEHDSPETVIRRFEKLPWQEQKLIVPKVSSDHSGFSFSMALSCAWGRLNRWAGVEPVQEADSE